MRKSVILLNGPSSSGKSTLAKALQTRISADCKLNYGIISIDDFLKMSTDQVIYEDDVYEVSGNLCQTALDELMEKDGIIIDHVMTSERINSCQKPFPHTPFSWYR